MESRGEGDLLHADLEDLIALCSPGTDSFACGAGGETCAACSTVTMCRSGSGKCTPRSLTTITLFGGGVQGYASDDTWEWVDRSWKQRQVTGPMARVEAVMGTLRGKIVVFGGFHLTNGTTDPVADTWVWDGASWAEQIVSGPSARWGTAVATLGDKLVLFGGFAVGAALDDTWEWNGISWTERKVAGPPARGYHGMATVESRVVLYGGQNAATQALGDTWEWDGNAWTERRVAPAPSPRIGGAIATLAGKAVMSAE